MPKQASEQGVRSSVELADMHEDAQSPNSSAFNTDTRREACFAVPNWWAAVSPIGFDNWSARNVLRFALLVGLATLVITASQSMVSPLWRLAFMYMRLAVHMRCYSWHVDPPLAPRANCSAVRPALA